MHGIQYQLTFETLYQLSCRQSQTNIHNCGEFFVFNAFLILSSLILIQELAKTSDQRSPQSTIIDMLVVRLSIFWLEEVCIQLVTA